MFPKWAVTDTVQRCNNEDACPLLLLLQPWGHLLQPGHPLGSIQESLRCTPEKSHPHDSIQIRGGNLRTPNIHSYDYYSDCADQVQVGSTPCSACHSVLHSVWAPPLWRNPAFNELFVSAKLWNDGLVKRQRANVCCVWFNFTAACLCSVCLLTSGCFRALAGNFIYIFI